MSGGRGAGDRPLTYAGEYGADRTYLAREVVTSGGLVYMSLGKSTGHAPPDATYWLPLGGGSLAPVIFSAAGVPPSGTYSPPYKVPAAASSIVLNGLLGTAGGSTTTVGVYAGATLLASVSLTSGVTDSSSTTSVSVAANTVIRLLASSVGTGAQDLTVEASFL